MDELTSFRERRKKARAERMAPGKASAKDSADSDGSVRGAGTVAARGEEPGATPPPSAQAGTSSQAGTSRKATGARKTTAAQKGGVRSGIRQPGSRDAGRAVGGRGRSTRTPVSLLPPDPGDARRTHQIGPTISMETVTLVESALEASHSAGDYTYENLPSVVRTAVDAYIEGKLPIGPRAKGGPKKRVSTLLTETEFGRYQHHFAKFGRKKGEVIERVVLAFLANSLKAR